MQPSYRKCQVPLLMIPSNNLDLKLLSLNIRGLRDFVKRKAVVNWINKQNADIIFLQETYRTAEIENEWKYHWKGGMFFSHGSNHSKGVLILTKNDLDFRAKKVTTDKNGRFIIMNAEIQDSQFLLVNLYMHQTP